MLFTSDYQSQLQQAIDENSFCGTYIKGDKAIFRPLRNSFNVAQTSLRRLSQNPDGNEIDALLEENLENWQQLSKELFDIFKSTSRDIELCGWFLTSQLQLDPSLKCFSIFLEWFAKLITEHWDNIQPLLPLEKLKAETQSDQNAERCEAKIKAFSQWLGDSEESCLLYASILSLPLVGNLTFFQYQSAERKGEVASLKQNISSIVAVERAEIQNKLTHIQKSQEALEKLALIVASQAQAANVSGTNFNFVKSLLIKIENAIYHLTGIKLSLAKTAPIIEEDPVSSDSEQISAQENPHQNNEGGNLLVISADAKNNLSQTAKMNSLNRDLVFHQLREISEYFRQSEPHSPISFLLEKAIRWGYMSLPDLLQEMMSESDSASLNKIFNVVGLDHDEQVLLPSMNNLENNIKKSSGDAFSTSQKSTSSDDKPAEKSNSASNNQSESKETKSSSTSLNW